MLNAFKLKNGLQVATYNLPNLRSVHLRLSCKGGSLVEDKRHSGIAHFMEHMLVQGIPFLPNVEAFAGYIESLAGSYSAYTESLLVGFNMTVPFTALEDALRISSEVFFEPLFSEDAVRRERGVVIDEIKQKMDSQWFKISEYFHRSIFKSTSPLIQFTGGSIKTLPKIKRQDMVDFWSKFFVPKNTYLLLTGDLAETNLREMLEKYFGRYNSSEGFLGFPSMSNDDFLSGGVKMRFDGRLKTDYIDFIFPSITLSDPLEERIKQNLALIILGQLRNSRLFKLLRYQKGLVYSVRAASAKYPNLGYVAVTSEVPPQHLEDVIRLITQEVDAYVKNGPSCDELSFAKYYLSNQWLMAFDHPSSIANWVEGDLLWEDNVMLPDEAINLIKKVTLQEVTETMQKYWDFSKLSLVIQGPTRKNAKVVQNFSEIINELVRK